MENNKMQTQCRFLNIFEGSCFVSRRSNNGIICNGQRSTFKRLVTLEAMNSKTVGICAGLAAATALVGYCVYFDKKRRSDPEFKKRLKAKRRGSKTLDKEVIREAEDGGGSTVRQV